MLGDAVRLISSATKSEKNEKPPVIGSDSPAEALSASVFAVDDLPDNVGLDSKVKCLRFQKSRYRRIIKTNDISRKLDGYGKGDHYRV